MNSSQKTRITVDIFGMQYKLMGNSSEDYMKKVAAHVNDQMNKIASSHPRLDVTQIAVLAAVNLTDEFNRQKQSWEQSSKQEETGLLDEYRQLKEELELARAEHAAEIERLKSEGQRSSELRDAFSRLQDDYAKLKNEFNEWIQLVEPDAPGRN